MREVRVAGALALLVVCSLLVSAANQTESAETPVVLRYREVHIAEDRHTEARSLWGRFGNHFRAHYGDATYTFDNDTVFRAFTTVGTLEDGVRVLDELDGDDAWSGLLELAKDVYLEDTTELMLPLGKRPFAMGPGLRILRVSHPRPASAPLAHACARRVTEHLNSQYPDVAAWAYTPAFADSSAIFWLFEYPDFATFETVQSTLLEDQAYLKLVGDAQDLFVGEEMMNAVWAGD